MQMNGKGEGGENESTSGDLSSEEPEVVKWEPCAAPAEPRVEVRMHTAAEGAVWRRQGNTRRYLHDGKQGTRGGASVQHRTKLEIWHSCPYVDLK